MGCLKLRVRNLTKNTILADRAGIADTSANIDVVFMNKKRQATKLRPNMVESRIALGLRAHPTLELPVGMIAKSQMAAGDQLDLENDEG